MTLIGFRAKNHPQQTARAGARPEIDDRATPPEVFEPLNKRFGFTLDVAATPENAKCERFYTVEDDGLRKPWSGERVWCNPPYSDIRRWVYKALSEAHRFEPEDRWLHREAWCRWCIPDADEGACLNGYGLREPAELIVMLLPANRTEQAWWQEVVEPLRDQPGSILRVEFLKGRLRFIRAGSTEVGPNERPPFGCCLLIWSQS